MALQAPNGRRAVFLEGQRIPFLKSSTAYKQLTSYDLARMAISGILNKTQLDAKEVDWVIMGNVVSNINTSNVAREAALAAGIPPKRSRLYPGPGLYLRPTRPLPTRWTWF